MKPLIPQRFIAVILLILICAALCSCGRQHLVESADINQNEAVAENPNKNNMENTHSEPAEPPAMFIFNSIEEYLNFQNTIELSDDEFALYISENSFDMNGIGSKDDAAAVCALIDPIPVPNAQGSALTEMIVYPEREQCFLKYKTAEDITCSYLFYLDKDKSADMTELKQNSNWQEIPISSDKINNVYYVANEDKNSVEAYYLMIDDYLVLFRAYECTSDDALELLKTVDYITFAEQ